MTNKTITMTIDEEDYIYLKKRGIARSEFMRQAVESLREGKIEFDFMR